MNCYVILSYILFGILGLLFLATFYIDWRLLRPDVLNELRPTYPREEDLIIPELAVKHARKIVFLDIDSVLQSWDYWERRSKQQRSIDEKSVVIAGLDPINIENLNRITDATGAAIVIISTIRKFHSLDELAGHLVDNGVRGTIIGCTTDLNQNRCRGREIDLWMKTFEGLKIEKFVIIDDGIDMEPHLDHLVRTYCQEGLTEDLANEAIAHLTGTSEA